MKKNISALSLMFLFCTFAMAQNVGIGTDIPQEKLHINGNLRADTLKPNAIKIITNAAVGKVLTSDAVGNASWQNNNSVNTISSSGNSGFGVWGNCATNAVITQYNPVVNEPFVAGETFGKALAISGNFALIGASSAKVGINNAQGSASIFKYNGTNWVFMQKLIDATGAASDRFGEAVAIDGNYAIVGTHFQDVGASIGQGSASIFRYNGSSWVFMQKLIDATGATFDNFGFSVAIHGNYAIVGANNDDAGGNTNQGSASVYFFNGTNWTLVNKLVNAVGNANDNFGNSVSITTNYAIVGIINDDITFMNQGSAQIYQLVAGNNWVYMTTINDIASQADDNFGNCVSIDSNIAIIGVPNDDDVGGINQGSACIFQYDGSNWVLMKKIIAASGVANNYFGSAVSISGNYVIIGEDGDDSIISTEAGSASIYQRLGNSWNKLQYITDPFDDNANGNKFGNAVSIDGDTHRFLIGTDYILLNYADKAFFGKVN